MIDSINRYYRYRTFDGSIKINSFLTRSWAFFRCHGKKTAKIRQIFLTVRLIDRYYRFSVYWWFDDHRSEKAFMIDCRYYRSKIQKSLTDGSITSWKWDQKYRLMVSIDRIDWYYRYRSIDSSPIVPIYAVLHQEPTIPSEKSSHRPGRGAPCRPILHLYPIASYVYGSCLYICTEYNLDI